MDLSWSFPNLAAAARYSRRILAPTVAAGVVILTGGAASALPVIDFQIVQPTSGVVGYAGGLNPLRGIGIEVDFVQGTGTPSNGGSYTCVDCTLNFQTGNLVAAGANGWVFAGSPGSSVITVRGGVDTNGDSIADIGGAGALLMAGTFTGPQLSVDFLPGSPLAFGFSAGMFLDVKNPDLASFFGLPAQPYSGELTLGWSGLGDPPGAFQATPRNGLVRNTFVPEPGSTLLLGAGLLMLLARRRRS